MKLHKLTLLFLLAGCTTVTKDTSLKPLEETRKAIVVEAKALTKGVKSSSEKIAEAKQEIQTAVENKDATDAIKKSLFRAKVSLSEAEADNAELLIKIDGINQLLDEARERGEALDRGIKAQALAFKTESDRLLKVIEGKNSDLKVAEDKLKTLAANVAKLERYEKGYKAVRFPFVAMFALFALRLLSVAKIQNIWLPYSRAIPFVLAVGAYFLGDYIFDKIFLR